MEKRGTVPLRRYGLPAYPTKLAVLARPELLSRHVPGSWLAHREIAAVAGTLLALDAAGCTQAPTSGPRPALSPTAAAVVAPIFAHGHGRVGTGCVAVTPPALLAEDEALQIIREELDRCGLTMSRHDVPLESVIIKGRTRVDGYEWVRGRVDSGWVNTKQPLEVDLLDPGRHVAVEFVSRADFYPLGGEPEGLVFSTAGEVDFAGVGKSLAKQVRRRGHGLYFGVFYEPAVSEWDCFPVRQLNAAVDAAQTPAERERAEAELQRLAEERRDYDHVRAVVQQRTAELLRAQVKDFVDWLKAQGVI